MNLVVVARRPEIGRALRRDHPGADRAPPVADDRRPVGRPGRAVVARRAGRGPLRAAARGRARDLRRDDPPDVRRRGRPPPRGDRRRRCIIHDLPVTVWWPGEPPLRARAGARPAGRRRPARRRRLDLERRRPRPARARWRRWPTTTPTRRSATSRSIRQSRWREAIASIFDDPDFLPYLRSLRRIAVTYATHDETGAPGSDEPRQARLPRRLAGVAARACRWSSRCARSPATAPAGDRPGDPRSGRQAGRRRGARGDAVRRPRRGRRRRPAGASRRCPPGTTLRVELLAERRGSELRADVTAEAETVHVRVWQDGVEALDRHFLRPAPDRGRPPRRGDRSRPARPGRGRRAALGGGARRPA